jgi:hypothetical protein
MTRVANSHAWSCSRVVNNISIKKRKRKRKRDKERKIENQRN